MHSPAYCFSWSPWDCFYFGAGGKRSSLPKLEISLSLFHLHQEDYWSGNGQCALGSVELFMAKTAFSSWRRTPSALSHKLSLTASVQMEQYWALPQPAHWKWYTCTNATLHLQTTQTQHRKSGRQSAMPTLPPVPQQVTLAHLEAGPTLPANSFTNSHRQLAARRAYSSTQSGAIPVKSQWFSTGLAILPACLSQAEETNTKELWSQRGFLLWKYQGTWPAAEQQAISCLMSAVVPQAAVLFCSRFNLGRPKEASNTHNRSGILKLIIP